MITSDSVCHHSKYDETSLMILTVIVSDTITVSMMRRVVIHSD